MDDLYLVSTLFYLLPACLEKVVGVWIFRVTDVLLTFVGSFTSSCGGAERGTTSVRRRPLTLCSYITTTTYFPGSPDAGNFEFWQANCETFVAQEIKGTLTPLIACESPHSSYNCA